MCSRHHPLCVHACVCVWLLVETYFRQNASIDGSQVNGILAIVIHTVNYLTERRVIFQIVCATAGYLPRVSVRHECFSWNGSFIWENRNSNIGSVCNWHWNWGEQFSIFIWNRLDPKPTVAFQLLLCSNYFLLNIPRGIIYGTGWSVLTMHIVVKQVSNTDFHFTMSRG